MHQTESEAPVEVAQEAACNTSCIFVHVWICCNFIVMVQHFARVNGEDMTGLCRTEISRSLKYVLCFTMACTCKGKGIVVDQNRALRIM